VPKEAVEAWYKELSNVRIVVPFSSKAGTSNCVAAIEALIKNFEMVGVIGMPNSGKHNLLHALRNLPNVIKYPGLAFKKTTDEKESSNVLLMNYSNSARVPNPENTAEALLNKIDLVNLTNFFGLYPGANFPDFLTQYARKRNFIRRVLFF
jgi:ABC-type dipeptide/oligopeptide/nickel transport system ATPase component